MKNYIFLLLTAFLFIFSSNSFAEAKSPPDTKDHLEITVDNLGTLSAPMPDITVNTESIKSESINNKQEVSKSPVISDQKVTGSLLYNDLKQLAIHYGTKADTILTKAFSVLSSTTQEVWDILVTQQRVKAFYGLTLIILEFILFWKWLGYVKLYFKIETDERSEGSAILLIVSAVFLLAFGIYNSINIMDVYTGLFNPKYAAMKDLLEMGSKLIK